MDEMFMKKMMKKGKEGPDMSEMERKAKMDVIMELLEMAQEGMGEGVVSGLESLKPKQSVTVAAPDEESLKTGLEVAEDMVDEKVAMSEDESEDEEETMNMSEGGMVETREKDQITESLDESKSMYGSEQVDAKDDLMRLMGKKRK